MKIYHKIEVGNPQGSLQVVSVTQISTFYLGMVQ